METARLFIEPGNDIPKPSEVVDIRNAKGITLYKFKVRHIGSCSLHAKGGLVLSVRGQKVRGSD